MRLKTTRWTASLALLSLAGVAACRDGSGPRDTAARDALQHDLDLAQSSAMNLAGSARDPVPTRFVSALEAGEGPSRAPGRVMQPTRRAGTKAPKAHARQTPAPAPVAIAAAPAAAAQETQPTPVPAATSTVASASAALPREGESTSPSDGGVATTTSGTSDGGVEISRRGRGIGGIIGVVMRGGGVGDDDHCERDHPSRMPYPLGRGVPSMGGIITMGGGSPRIGGMGRGTFPGRM